MKTTLVMIACLVGLASTAKSEPVADATSGAQNICSAILANSSQGVLESLRSGGPDQKCQGSSIDQNGRPTTWSYSATFFALSHPEVNELIVEQLIRAGASPVFSDNVLRRYEHRCRGGRWGQHQSCSDSWYSYPQGTTVALAIKSYKFAALQLFIQAGFVLVPAPEAVNWRSVVDTSGTAEQKQQMLQIYLAQGADQYKGSNGESLLGVTFTSSEKIEFKKAIIQTWNFSDPRESHQAASYLLMTYQSLSDQDAMAMTQLLIDRGGDIDSEQGVALRTALYRGMLATAKLLLDNRASVRLGDRDASLNGMALHLVQNLEEHDTNLSLMKRILKAGAPVNGRNSEGATPLIWTIGLSSEAQILPRVQLLLASGADVNAAADDGTTALCQAHQNKLSSVEHLLMRHHAELGQCPNP